MNLASALPGLDLRSIGRRALLAGFLFVSACTRDPETLKQRYVASGDAYFAQQKYAEATIEYSRALQVDSQFGLARLRLADAYSALGNTKAAFPEYVRAADLLPDNADAQVKAGRLLVNGGFFEEAKDRARKVLVRDPKNVDALMVLGNALAGLKSVDDAVGVIGQASQVDPERAGVYANLGVFQLAQGDLESAEATFTKALAVAPQSIEALVNLGNFYRAAGRHADAERILKQAYAIDPKDERTNRALGSLYVESNRAAAAEPYFKAVVETSTGPNARFSLSDYYVRIGRYADAVKTLEDLAAAPAQYATARTQIAMLEFASGRRATADAIIDDVLKREPRNATALTTKARLLLVQERYDDAAQAIKVALSIAPGSPDAQLTLGRIELAKHNLENARKAFNETLRLDPRSLAAQLELSELHRNAQQFDTAVQFAEQAIRMYPANVPARLTLVRALLVRPDDRPRAERELRALQTAHPESARVQGAMGALMLDRNDLNGASRAFQRELDIDPGSMEALAGLVSIDLTRKNVAAAQARVNAALARNSNAAGPLVLAAKIYRLSGDTAKMQQALHRAVELDPSNPEAFGMLGHSYLAEGKITEAKAQYSETVRLQPNSVGALTMLGLLNYAEGNRVEAQRWWEKALEVDPNAVTAANNLAWLYTEAGGDLDTALLLARRALAKSPDEPEFNDTVGWIYYHKKSSREAIWYLEQSVNKAPDNPEYHFHLGMAYAQKGEDASARRHLQRALAIDPKFPGAEDARKTIATLVY